ncbi:MAG: SCP2 sterol-binding domain-containing protein [Thermoprotei archaeon]|jgi:putative sterol carrier protein
MSEDIKSLIQTVYEKAKLKMGSEMAGWNKVFQFNIEGGEPFYIEFKQGNVNVVPGSHKSPTATLIMSKETLIKILKGELDSMAAFIRGQMKITGNVIETTSLRKMIEAAKS